MDLLTLGIWGGLYILVYESVVNIRNRFDVFYQALKKLNLSDFKIVETKDIICGKEITLKVPVGKSVSNLECKKEVLENYFKGKIFFEVVPFSDLVKVTVISNDIDGITQPKKGSPYKVPIGFDYLGESIIADFDRNSGMLINGVPGVGKSVLLKQINTYLVNNGAKMYYAQYVKNDLKRLGVDVADTLDKILGLTKELLEIINSGSNEDLNVLLIDEFSFLVPSKSDDKDTKDKKDMIINNISLILRICRSEKVRVILSTQKVVAEFLPTSISSMLETKITFKTADEKSSEMVLGHRAAFKLKFREFILIDSEGERQGKTYKE